MKASKFFGCYDTGFEYDILETMSTRYNLQRKEKRIEFGDNGGFDASLLAEYRVFLEYNGVERISVSDLEAGLKERGIEGDLKGNLGKKLKTLGFEHRQSRKGNFYDLSEPDSPGT